MEQHDVTAFHALAHCIFPGSQIVHIETYESARDRMLGWIKTLRDRMGPVERWRLACVAATRCARTLHPPHGDWARRLLKSDLTDLLGKLHSAGLARDYPSTDPSTWPTDRAPLHVDF